MSAVHRPADVSWWIKSARKGRIDVKTSPLVYVSEWHAWWLQVNPKWRDCEDDQLIIGGEGDWKDVLHSGSNGFVNILASIDALCRVADQSTIIYAITDAAWVMGQLLRTAGFDGAPIR